MRFSSTVTIGNQEQSVEVFATKEHIEPHESDLGRRAVIVNVDRVLTTNGTDVTSQLSEEDYAALKAQGERLLHSMGEAHTRSDATMRLDRLTQKYTTAGSFGELVEEPWHCYLSRRHGVELVELRELQRAYDRWQVENGHADRRAMIESLTKQLGAVLETTPPCSDKSRKAAEIIEKTGIPVVLGTPEGTVRDVFVRVHESGFVVTRITENGIYLEETTDAAQLPALIAASAKETYSLDEMRAVLAEDGFTMREINTVYGFFGTMAHFGNVSKQQVLDIYNVMVDRLESGPPETADRTRARQYLDSSYGRHFVDTLTRHVNAETATVQDILKAIEMSVGWEDTASFWRRYKRFEKYEDYSESGEYYNSGKKRRTFNFPSAARGTGMSAAGAVKILRSMGISATTTPSKYENMVAVVFDATDEQEREASDILYP